MAKISRRELRKMIGKTLAESREDHKAGISAKIDRLQAHINRLEAEIEKIEDEAREAEAATGSHYDYLDVTTDPKRDLHGKRSDQYRYEDQMEFLQSQLDAFEEAGDGPVSLPRRD